MGTEPILKPGVIINNNEGLSTSITRENAIKIIKEHICDLNHIDEELLSTVIAEDIEPLTDECVIALANCILNKQKCLGMDGEILMVYEKYQRGNNGRN